MWNIRLKSYLIRRFTQIYGWRYPVTKTVLCDSFVGRQYSDNPKAISEKMHELYPEFNIVWAIDNPQSIASDIPSYVNICPRKGKEFYKQLAKCFCYITNETNGDEKFKRKNQLFIQTWHGDRAFKKILLQCRENKFAPDIHDPVVTDICVSGSEFGNKLYREAFGFGGEIVTNGCPRNDCLINTSQEKVSIIKQKLGLNCTDKLLLYAPTFRDSNRDIIDQEINIEDTLNALNSKNGNWVCLYRNHPTVRSKFFSENKNIINVSNYSDMADLLLVADMLITDYSSSATDFALTGRPILIAAFDIEDYKKRSRDLSVDIEEVGFYIAYNQTELNSYISNLTYDDYLLANRKVLDFYKTKETGNASALICERINDEFKKIKN